MSEPRPPVKSDAQEIAREVAKQSADRRLEDALRRRPELAKSFVRVVPNKMVDTSKVNTK